MPRESYYLPSRRLVSQEDSSIIKRPTIPRSKFIGHWTRKTAFDAGYLVPFLVDEILPGDHMRYNVTAYVRMSTPLFPIFDNQRVDTFFFFVPNRILWVNWVKMMGEQANPADSISYNTPDIPSPVGGYAVGSLFDHMGLPVAGQIDPGQQLWTSVMPLRAYNKIWNDWFRDQNIQNSAAEITANGPDVPANYSLLRRAKAQDYFTTALPWPQKFTAPATPLSGQAPVTGIGMPFGATNNTGPFTAYESDGAAAVYANAADPTSFGNLYIKTLDPGGGGQIIPQVFADLSAATGVAINTFRQAFMVQTLLERDARGGTRYTELIRNHFGVINPDFRLQRAEYIGGGQSPLNITPIAQTAPSASAVVGALGAAGTSAGTHEASYAATEHGFIIGLINVRTELSYQQGLHKMWTRGTRYDYYWPTFAELGEQAILRKEIYCVGNALVDDLVFGYQERWHEYRTRYSEVTGIMRSTATGTLDAWHLAQRFSAAPTLSDTFIQDTPPMDRVLAAGALAAGQQYLADIMIQRTATRPLPTFGTPATLGRF